MSHGSMHFGASCNAQVVPILCLSLLTAVGTSSTIKKPSERLLRSTTTSYITSIEESNAQAGSVGSIPDNTGSHLSSVDKLQHIKEYMNLSTSVLARLLNTSRQTVHNWLNGSVIAKENEEKVQTIFELSRVIKDKGISLTSFSLNRVISGEMSLYKSIETNTDPHKALTRLIDTLAIEFDQMKDLKFQSVGDSDDFITPHLL